jgi:Domain of unknown function (DUF3883)
MSSDEVSGTDWTSNEVELVVGYYFDMLDLELARVPFNKSARNAELHKLIGRSRGSIERKHQNISAVMNELGLPWIDGYKPLKNYQQRLLSTIEVMLPKRTELFTDSQQQATSEVAAPEELFYEAPPQLSTKPEPKDAELERLIRKFDPAARDEKNRTLGKRGEELIFHSELARVASSNSHLIDKVKWVSRDEGDGAGFDILSFDENGNEKLLEVKTTVGHQTTPFFISANELQVSQERPNAFRLVRLYNFAKKPKVFELRPPLSESVLLKTSMFKAYFEQ